MRTCTKCGETKDESKFYKRTGKSYTQAECKACSLKRSQTHYYGPKYESHKKRDREYGREKNIRIKDAVFKAYGGYKCACCGELEPKFLSLDHINNDGAEFRRRITGKRTGAGNQTYRWIYKNAFPDGFQVLCMNCNHGKRMNNGVCPHLSRCNDHPEIGVESSDSKRRAPIMKVVG